MDIVKSLESCDHEGYKAVIFLKYTFKSYNVIILLYSNICMISWTSGTAVTTGVSRRAPGATCPARRAGVTFASRHARVRRVASWRQAHARSLNVNSSDERS